MFQPLTIHRSPVRDATAVGLLMASIAANAAASVPANGYSSISSNTWLTATS
jgi:hypothetical protein